MIEPGLIRHCIRALAVLSFLHKHATHSLYTLCNHFLSGDDAAARGRVEDFITQLRAGLQRAGDDNHELRAAASTAAAEAERKLREHSADLANQGDRLRQTQLAEAETRQQLVSLRNGDEARAAAVAALSSEMRAVRAAQQQTVDTHIGGIKSE
jgi:hypothetical protein